MNATLLPNRWTHRLPMRLSVRKAMVLVLIVALSLGWLVHRVRQQRAAVQAVLAQGGIVEYDYQRDPIRGVRLPNAKPWEPSWLNKFLGDDYLHNVVVVGFNKSPPTDADLAEISDLVHVKWLYLGGGRITDDGLRHLARLTDLRLLVLWGNAIQGVGLTSLQNLENLRHLDLSMTKVEDGQLDGLASLTALERLDIHNNPQLKGSFLRFIVGLPNLKEVVLRGSGVTDSALAYLNSSKSIDGLMLDGTKVTDDGIEHLREMTNLRLLDLRRTAITDAGLMKIRKWLPSTGVTPTFPIE